MKNKIEGYKLPQGRIFVLRSNTYFSAGVLYLAPHKALEKHNRPVAEQLRQVIGSSTIKLFKDNKRIQKVKLNKGNHLVIPANQFHVHSNITSKSSVTIWRFDGNITKIIDDIRNGYKKLL